MSLPKILRADTLNSEWTLSVSTQTVNANGNGGFRIANIVTPDKFGEDGPGSSPDFISDDFVRLTGYKTAGNATRYVWSRPFQITQGRTFVLSDSDLTFSDTPLVKPEFIRVSAPTTTLITIGATEQLTTTAIYPDSTPDLSDNPTEDVTPRSKYTVYRTTNPQIATVSKDGLVTATGDGNVIITAVNSMISASLQMKMATITRTSVEGFVRFADGTPASGASVQLVPQTTFQTITDAQGHFVISDVRADQGNIAARASHPASGLVALLSNLPPVPNGVTDLGICTLGVRTPGFEPFGTQQQFSDDTPHTVSLGAFSFPFFGQTVSGQFELSPNGLLIFNGGSNGSNYQNIALPYNSLSLIAPFFDDVDPSQGGQIGIYQTADQLVVTWELVPYYGRSENVTFQVVIRSNGIIEFRYANMASPPGGTADNGPSIGTATVGLQSSTTIAVPSIGTIINAAPTFGLTDATGLLDVNGLSKLTQKPGLNTLVFTPDGSGSYSVVFN